MKLMAPQSLCLPPLVGGQRSYPACSSSPLLSFPALGSSRRLCNKAGRGMKGGERRMESELEIYYLFTGKEGGVKGLHRWFLHVFATL